MINNIHLVTGYFVSDLYKFWFMLFIGKQIMFDCESSITQKTMKTIEHWATKKYGSWPTYSSLALAELIQIKIVDHQTNALP